MNDSLLVIVLAQAVLYGTPLLYASLGELLAERSGVLNLGVEGMMLFGAAVGYWATQRVQGSTEVVLTVAIVSLAIGPRTFKPSLLGKGATALFIVTCVVVMYFNYLGTTSVVVDVFIWASLAITLMSGLHYIVHATRLVAHD